MYYALWDALAVELSQFLDEVVVMQDDWAAGANGLGELVRCDRRSAIGSGVVL